MLSDYLDSTIDNDEYIQYSINDIQKAIHMMPHILNNSNRALYNIEEQLLEFYNENIEWNSKIYSKIKDIEKNILDKELIRINNIK